MAFRRTEKNVFPELPVRMDAKEAFAKDDETGDVKNRVGSELMQLQSIDKKQPAKKIVGRKRKAAENEVKEHYPPSSLRARFHLVAGDLSLRARRQQSVLPQLAQIGGGALGSLPANDLLLRAGGAGRAGGALCRGLRFPHSGQRGAVNNLERRWSKATVEQEMCAM